MAANTQFQTELIKLLKSNLYNDYADNVDIYRFGKNAATPKKSPLRKVLSHLKSNIEATKNFKNRNLDTISYFEYLYGLLKDDYSKNLLVQVCAFRILGYRKIKLPVNSPEFWNGVSSIENKLADKNDFLQTNFKDWKLFKHDLSPIGYPIKLYMRPLGIYYTFVYKGYVFNNGETTIGVREGDYVIDGGACFGDTALFFANQVGKEGKVYSFEFVPENLDALNQNFSLNPELKGRIKIIQNPLWSNSGTPVYFESNGPATHVSMKRISEKSSFVDTKTIDDLVSEGTIEKVDFIKMDIEGAETNALKGAENTLRKYKPRLAICLYHSPLDFKAIPEYLNSLNIGYKFYFNHYTMHAEESVLFCTTE